MNRQLGRLLLAGLCGLTAAPAVLAQPPLGPRLPVRNGPVAADNTPRPSHLPLNVGDLSGAEDLLARRLQHTRDAQQLQDLVGPLLKDKQFQKMLQQKFKDLKPEDIQELQETIQKHPELLDDPKLRDLAQKFKQDGGLDDLPLETKDDLAKWAKDFIEKQKPPDPAGTNPMTGTPPPPPPPPNPVQPPSPPPAPKAPPDSGAPSWLSRDVLQGAANLLKDLDQSPEGKAMRNDILRELAKMDSRSSGSSDLADWMKGFLSSDEVNWLAHNFKAPSAPNLGGWSPPAVSAGPSVGGSPDALMDGMIWVVAAVMVGAAAWGVVAAARRQAAKAREQAWSPGPWPVRPSQVSTRRDLIRAFEHLAYLLLGRPARSMNHLDVAARLGGEGDGRADAAARLARLYEQARYAPADEALPVHELTAARGDLAALAGAAA